LLEVLGAAGGAPIPVPPVAAVPGTEDPLAASALGAAASASAETAGIISLLTRKVLFSLVGLRG